MDEYEKLKTALKPGVKIRARLSFGIVVKDSFKGTIKRMDNDGHMFIDRPDIGPEWVITINEQTYKYVDIISDFGWDP